MNYYNEIDPFAAEWLQNLIDADEIPPGRIDTRSIKDVRASELIEFRQCHFFAGIGGWSLALRLAGWPDDVAVWTGSCPCQPFSQAGQRKGVEDERHLWPTFGRLINERRPAIVFGEQVASKDGREWLAGVRADLEALAYACGGADLCAAGAGSPTIRQRLWWVAVAEGNRSWQDSLAGSNCAGEAERRFVEPGGHGTIGRLADNSQDGRGQRGQVVRGRHQGIRAEGDRGGSADCGHDRGLANAHVAELRGEPPAGQQPIDEPHPGASWGRYAVLECTDGKSRRIERGSFPLAYGIPTKTRPIISRLVELGHSATDARRLVRDAKRNRPGRLKGYGNAIVPQVAAEFIGAFMEATMTRPSGL